MAYCGIGILNGKSDINYGTLLRSAYMFNVNFAFIIGRRFKKQASDTYRSERHMPVFEFLNFEEAYANTPHGCQWVAVEQTERSMCLFVFRHPENVIYLLGAEDTGIPNNIIEKCKHVVSIPTERSLNVAVAGSIVLYDRFLDFTGRVR